jgi:adenylate cyclase
MVKEREQIVIDLEQFKLHIDVPGSMVLSLHFDSPSRRFYLAVMAFLTNEMKRRGKIMCIPLRDHYGVLVKLNESVGGSAGSSEEENLLPRIYRKWKNVLPNLEEAPLFKVLGRQKEYGISAGRAYRVTEEEKDLWANLFEYTGSEANTRLRFSIDRLGVGLEGIAVRYKDDHHSKDKGAWERFLDDLQNELKADPLGVAEARDDFSYTSPEKPSVAIAPFADPSGERPSIAVLPFASIGSDPYNEYLSDGLPECIITALSKSINIAVIARNSSFIYKGKPVNVQQVGSELGVRYVLEGSVSKTGERIRITARLIDAVKGHSLWAEQYERLLGAICEIEEEIVKKVIVALHVQLAEGEQARIFAKGTDCLEGYLKVFQARELFHTHIKEDNLRVRRLAAEALALDPDYAMAICVLALTYLSGALLGWSESPDEALGRAEELARKAIALDDSLFFAHGVLSNVHAITGRYEQAIVEGERTVTLGPNSSEAYWFYSYTLHLAGKYKESIRLNNYMLRLDPFPRLDNLYAMAGSYFCEGIYEKSIECCEKAIRLDPDAMIAHLQLAANCSFMGLEDKARDEIMEVMRIDPTFSLDNYEKSLIPTYKDKTGPRRFMEALRKVWPREEQSNRDYSNYRSLNL